MKHWPYSMKQQLNSIKGIIPKSHVVIGSVEPLKEGSPAVESYNLKRKIEPIQEIKEIYFHSKYQEFKKEAYYDIAITILKQEIKLNKFLHPLCLPVSPVVQNAGEETDRSVQSHNVIVTGYVTGNPKTTGRLHKIEPQIRTQSFCDEKFSGRPLDEEVIREAIPNGFKSTIFCAAVETGTEASCRGDSGAPLFRYEAFNGNLSDFRYVQIGVLHGSVNSCDNTYPGIYSRLEEPSIHEFLKSHGKVNGNLVYSASKAVDCRWSLWTDCKPCKGGEQTRKITRNKECDNQGLCGKECSNIELIKQSCPIAESCDIENPQKSSICDVVQKLTNTNWCRNDGSCFTSIDSPNTPKCKCPPNFIGERCGLAKPNVTACDVIYRLTQTQWCKNNGTCFSSDTSLTSLLTPKCICPPGFIGDRCEIVEPACDVVQKLSNTNWCKNNGSCFTSIDLPNTPKCKCPAGFIGDRCEIVENIETGDDEIAEPIVTDNNEIIDYDDVIIQPISIKSPALCLLPWPLNTDFGGVETLLPECTTFHRYGKHPPKYVGGYQGITPKICCPPEEVILFPNEYEEFSEAISKEPVSNGNETEYEYYGISVCGILGRTYNTE